MAYQGFGAGGLAVPTDFSSAAPQSFGIRVAKFELDMLAVALDCFAADAELFCDLTYAVLSRDECEHCHFAIAENIETGWKIAITGKLVHGEGSDCFTGVNLAPAHSLNRVH
jgi:hypothetical protein